MSGNSDLAAGGNIATRKPKPNPAVVGLAKLAVFFHRAQNNTERLKDYAMDPILTETSAGKMASNALFTRASRADNILSDVGKTALNELIEVVASGSSTYNTRLLVDLMNEPSLSFFYRAQIAQAFAEMGEWFPLAKLVNDTRMWATKNNETARQRFGHILGQHDVTVNIGDQLLELTSDEGHSLVPIPKGEDRAKWEMLNFALDLLGAMDNKRGTKIVYVVPYYSTDLKETKGGSN